MPLFDVGKKVREALPEIKAHLAPAVRAEIDESNRKQTKVLEERFDALEKRIAELVERWTK